MKIVSRQWSVASKSVFCFALCAMLFALCASAPAQQREKIHRIGYLSSGKPSTNTDPGLDAFRQRLRQLGYVEGQNVLFEYRYGELDAARLLVGAKDLANLKVDVILTSPDEPPIRAAQSATGTIPVVMPGIVVDPMESTFWEQKQRAPLVASLAKPGGKFTGLTNLASELHPKRLELLKEASPHIFRVALLWPRAQQQKQTLKDIEAVRQALKIEIQSLAAGVLDDFERVVCPPGTLVHVPAGTMHSFRYLADGCDVLEITGHGGIATQMFTAISREISSGSAEIPKLLEVLKQNGVTVQA